MEIEKTAVLSAPIERVWLQILDPKIMAMCVPGMQSIDVISDKEYLAQNFTAFFRRDYKRVAELHIESGWVPASTLSRTDIEPNSARF